MCGRYFKYGTNQEVAEFVRARRITAQYPGLSQSKTVPWYVATDEDCPPSLFARGEHDGSV